MILFIFFLLVPFYSNAMELPGTNQTDKSLYFEWFTEQPTPIETNFLQDQSEKWFLKSNYKKRKLQEPQYKAAKLKSDLLFTFLCVEQEQVIQQEKMKGKMETGNCPLCPFKYEDNYQKQKDHFSVEHSRYKNACMLCFRGVNQEKNFVSIIRVSMKIAIDFFIQKNALCLHVMNYLKI